MPTVEPRPIISHVNITFQEVIKEMRDYLDGYEIGYEDGTDGDWDNEFISEWADDTMYSTGYCDGFGDSFEDVELTRVDATTSRERAPF